MNDEKLSAIATHLYVRLRRDGGRVIDVNWLTRNQEYAHEVLQIARAIPDDEVAKLADRFEEVMFGVVRSRAAATNHHVAEPVLESESQFETEVANKYRGHLR